MVSSQLSYWSQMHVTRPWALSNVSGVFFFLKRSTIYGEEGHMLA